jgi:hypothetical protein
MRIRRPPERHDEEEELLAEYALPLTMISLSRKNLLLLLSAVLLEKKVCLVASTARTLSCTVYARCGVVALFSVALCWLKQTAMANRIGWRWCR